LAKKETALRQFKTAGLLALALIALGLLATWNKWKTKKEKTAKESQNRLAEFDVAQITSIDYYNAGHAPGDDASGNETATSTGSGQVSPPLNLKAAKIDGTWQITEPFATKADEKAIENLLSTLKDYKYEKIASESADDRQKFGLTPPRRRVTAYAGDKVIADILVGSNAPVGYHVYSSTSDRGATYIGSQYLAVATNKSLFDMRDKTLARISPDSLTSFTLRSFSSNPFTISRQNNQFQITAPEAADADELSVKNFLEDLERAPVVEIIDSPSNDLLKAVAVATESYVKWTLNNGTSRTLKAVEAGKEVYCKLDDSLPLYRMGPEFKKKFSQKSADFRNKRIFRFTAQDVSAIDVDGKKYSRVADEWYEPEVAAKFSPQGKFEGSEETKPSGLNFVRSLIVDLEFARAIDFLDDEVSARKIAETPPAHRVTLTFANPPGKSPLVIDLWPDKPEVTSKSAPDTATAWILRNGDTQKFFRVSKSLTESLAADNNGKSPNSESPMPSEGSDQSRMDVALPEAVDDAAKNDISGISN